MCQVPLEGFFNTYLSAIRETFLYSLIPEGFLIRGYCRYSVDIRLLYVLALFFPSSLYPSSVLQVSDTGQYVCKATNVAGQVDKNFHLNIYGSIFRHSFIQKSENSWNALGIIKQCLLYNIKEISLSLSSVPPSIDGPAEESVVETVSNPVIFACDATGIPPPSLAWLKNGRLIGTPSLFICTWHLNQITFVS